jgi:hypothetical protein
LGENQVVVRVENDGHFRKGPDLGNKPENVALATTGLKGPLRRQLIGLAIGKGIRERNPEFKQIDPVIDQGSTNLQGSVEIGITCAYVANEGGPPFFFAIREKLRDSIRSIHKFSSVNVSQSRTFLATVKLNTTIL